MRRWPLLSAQTPEKSDVWIEDAAIASIVLHLAATASGLGSCWVQIRLREHDAQQTAQEYVAELLGLRKGMVVESIIGIGYPAEEKTRSPPNLLFRMTKCILSGMVRETNGTELGPTFLDC